MWSICYSNLQCTLLLLLFHWMKGRRAIQPDFLREVEIYVPDIEYRTCFYSSQDTGESWWPSKCYKWTFGLKSRYQQVREVLKFHICLPTVGSSIFVIRKIWYSPIGFWKSISVTPVCFDTFLSHKASPASSSTFDNAEQFKQTMFRYLWHTGHVPAAMGVAVAAGIRSAGGVA